MSFENRDLSVLAYANGFTLWHYTSTDQADDVDNANYFSEAADMLRVGDVIIANLETDGSDPKTGLFAVRTSDDTTVDLFDLTKINQLNTD